MTQQKNSESSGALEFDKIIDKVLDETFSAPGKDKLIRLQAFFDPDKLERELALVTEMRDCLKYDDAFPLSAFSDLRPELKKTEVAGAFLRPEIFLSIKQFLMLVRQLKSFFSNRPDKYPLIQRLVQELIPIPELEHEIDRMIGPSSEILDRASEKLSRIRIEIRKKEADVRKCLNTLLREMVSNGFAQEDQLVLRDGRLVIPMIHSSQSRLKGIVVDQSASGGTLFIEPYETVEMNNEIRKLKIQEKTEEEEICKRLTAEVGQNRQVIRNNQEATAELDSISARARFSLKIQGNAGKIARDGKMELKGARHPLLLIKLGRDRVEPLNLKMGGELQTVIITGPNAGGKTVTLKTVGLSALMHQHGYHVSAEDDSRFPVFSNIFVDIGDRQSIEQDLSTFSSHIQMIKTVLDRADSRSLVLLDEIGSATDPDEGSALARSILGDLTRRGCLTLATTHMGALKVFAHETPGVENASLAFDQKTLRPTYRFQMGIPGSSYAFEIVKRFDFPDALIQEARNLAGAERGRLDKLIADLEKETRQAHELLAKAEIEESRLTGLVALYQGKMDQIREEAEITKQSMLQEAEALLRETNRQAENMLREIKESKGNPDAVRNVRSNLAEYKKHIILQKKKIQYVHPAHFQSGDWVVWEGHTGRAKVLSNADAKGKLWIQWENIRLQIPVCECRAIEKTAEAEPKESFVHFQIDSSVKDEVDLRGMTVDEAVPVLEKYLSDAASAGLSQARVIHGKGTGVLRKEIGLFLKKHALIKNQRYGNWNEGDIGVTVVEFK